jgi:hypothetical protein
MTLEKSEGLAGSVRVARTGLPADSSSSRPIRPSATRASTGSSIAKFGERRTMASGSTFPRPSANADGGAERAAPRQNVSKTGFPLTRGRCRPQIAPFPAIGADLMPSNKKDNVLVTQERTSRLVYLDKQSDKKAARIAPGTWGEYIGNLSRHRQAVPHYSAMAGRVEGRGVIGHRLGSINVAANTS